MPIPEFKYKGEPLNAESIKLVTAMLLNRDKEEEASKDTVLKDTFFMQMIRKRIEAYSLPFKLSNFFIGASLMSFVDSPAKVMILLWLSHMHAKKTGTDYLDIKEWCMLFPMGTPSDEELRIMWDSQKCPNSPLGNMLDDYKNWV